MTPSRAGALALLIFAASFASATAQPGDPASAPRPASAASSPDSGARAASSSCVSCHAAMDDEELRAPAALWAADVHAAAGLGCNSCHGGDPSPEFAEDNDAAMDPAKGFRPAPSRLQIAEFCARCHADAAFMKRYNPQARVDQLAEYRTSVHGQKNAAGDSVPATCIDCHGVHGIREVSSPESPAYATNVPKTCARCHADSALMAPYGIPTNQFEEYGKSMHAVALLERGDAAAPACNDCHGNHGASPPGVLSVAHVCGQCHGREGALFRDSFKQALFDGLGVKQCTICHDHHRIRHPTPELFHGGSAPEVSQGQTPEGDAFVWMAGDLASGAGATASWEAVLRPYVKPEDPRLAHAVEIAAGGAPALTIDATVRPGALANELETPRVASNEALSARLSIEALSGSPVEAGDALRFRIAIEAKGDPVHGLVVRDVPGPVLQPVAGSVCLTCHSPGDSCDQSAERMYASVDSLERNLRSASFVLKTAAIAGMEVSAAQFELKSKGTTAAVEARALIHAFDPVRLIARTAEGDTVARAALAAGRQALHEREVRRRGLAVSLVVIGLVLFGLRMKIKQVERARRNPPSQ